LDNLSSQSYAFFFSIVIPTYNRAEFIQKAIRSILNQSFSDFEIIIVDDGSTDQTEAIVKDILSERLRYIKIKNSERGAARNAGIKMATGRYISFLDSDDILYTNYLSTAFDFLSTNQFPGALHVAYEIITSEGAVLKKVNTLKSINKEIIQGNPLSCIGVFIREDVMRVNLFNEDRDLSGLEDWELWIRIAAGHIIFACNIIGSAIVHHDHRSVLDSNSEKLFLKAERFLHYVLNNKNISQVYGRELRKTSASVKTYVALHLAISKASNRIVWRYLKAGVSDYKGELFRRRFWVVIKLMIGL
jgi:glycosyltransferase involved in cell wall biosynthesis